MVIVVKYVSDMHYTGVRSYCITEDATNICSFLLPTFDYIKV